jgi:hypothetical protein
MVVIRLLDRGLAARRHGGDHDRDGKGKGGGFHVAASFPRG